MNEKNEIDVNVLAERVENNQAIINLQLSHIKTNTAIIITVLTLIGVASIWTLIRSIVKETTENKLEQILTDEYIEKQVRTRSEKTINKLIKETEVRTLKIIEKYSTYEDWNKRAFEAFEEGRLKDAILFYDRTAKKAQYSDKEKIRVHRKYQALLGKAEAELIFGEYHSTLETLKQARQLPIKALLYDYTILPLIECIAQRVIKMDTKESEAKLNGILAEAGHRVIHWDLKPLEDWLKKSKLNTDDKEYIQKIITYTKEKSSYSPSP